MADVYICTEAFAYPGNDGTVVVSQGAIVNAEDPAYKANPGAFKTGDEAADRRTVVHHAEEIEQATAAPGEKRDHAPKTRRRAASDDKD